MLHDIMSIVFTRRPLAVHEISYNSEQDLNGEHEIGETLNWNEAGVNINWAAFISTTLTAYTAVKTSW